MVDFGDEVVLQGYRVPWLIWIQMLVFILLLFFIYCDTIFCSSDLSVLDGDLLASSQLSKGKKKTAVVNCLRVSEIEGIKGVIATSRRRRIVNDEVISEREGLSIKDRTQSYSHPCHIIRLARMAFLKCLGLEPDQSSSSGNQTRES